MKKLEYIGNDSWSRPVYKDENGKLWKDTSMGRIKGKHNLCSAVNNEFDGEPDCPIKSTIEVIFIPEQINTWDTKK